MPLSARICALCDESFILVYNKPGNINHCPECSTESHPPPRGISYSIDKHAMTMQMAIIHDRAQADAYSQSQRRSGGQGVLKSIVARKS